MTETYFRRMQAAYDGLGNFRDHLPASLKAEIEAALAHNQGKGAKARKLAQKAMEAYARQPEVGFQEGMLGFSSDHVLRVGHAHGLNQAADTLANEDALLSMNARVMHSEVHRFINEEADAGFVQRSDTRRNNPLIRYLERDEKAKTYNALRSSSSVTSKTIAKSVGMTESQRIMAEQARYLRDLRRLDPKWDMDKVREQLEEKCDLTEKQKIRPAVIAVEAEVRLGYIENAAKIARLHGLDEAEALERLHGLLKKQA